MQRCEHNPSMECPTPYSCWHDTNFYFKIHEYFLTTLLKASSFEPVTSGSSDFANAKQHAMGKRVDIALCVTNEDTMLEHFQTGKVNRRTCAAFKAAEQEYKKRCDTTITKS